MSNQNLKILCIFLRLYCTSLFKICDEHFILIWPGPLTSILPERSQERPCEKSSKVPLKYHFKEEIAFGIEPSLQVFLCIVAWEYISLVYYILACCTSGTCRISVRGEHLRGSDSQGHGLSQDISRRGQFFKNFPNIFKKIPKYFPYFQKIPKNFKKCSKNYKTFLKKIAKKGLFQLFF